MISPKVHTFTCDDCQTQQNFCNISQAREHGWGVARDRLHCYCPKCAPHRRYVGCCGRRRNIPSWK